MKFLISIHSPPESPAALRALRFTEALCTQGHEIIRLFFYQEGIQNAVHTVVLGQDELHLHQAWVTLLRKFELEAVVCIAASVRRGFLDQAEALRLGHSGYSIQAPWLLGGLGQWHDALQRADRLVSFGGH